MSNTFLCSDLHAWHLNIIRFQKDVGSRPFNSVEEMNDSLIAGWNSVVTAEDTVINLGDFIFREPSDLAASQFFHRLNRPKRMILIRGNHEKAGVKLPWDEICDYKEIAHNDKSWILFHYPISSWNRQHYGSYHAHGHIHSTFPINNKGPILKNRIDVGVDNLGFVPLTLEQIEGQIKFQNEWLENQEVLNTNGN